MAFLLLYLDDWAPFDATAIEQAVISSGGKHTTESYGRALATYLYSTANDSTVVLVAPDLQTIKIDGEGPASLDIALKIQADYPTPIHLIDEGYSCDLLLTNFNSVDQLTRQLS